jgi:phosphomannomutase
MAGIFKAYDIRGSYPDELDEKMAERIGSAFARFLSGAPIVIGRDMRLSSPGLAASFARGYTAAGGAVTDIGTTSTPLLYYAIIEGKFGGGAMITASHLPGNMNGIKVCGKNAVPLSGDKGLPELERLAGERQEIHGSPAGTLSRADMMDSYIRRLSRAAQPGKELTVVVDAGDGMAGPEAERFFRLVPAWKMIPLYLEPDGTFPHHGANPFIHGATQDLRDRVKEAGADLGVAFDGDADRCCFVDDTGELVDPGHVMALLAGYFLNQAPGSAILYDLRSSRIVPETVERLGGHPVRSRVGHAFIKDLMRKEDAVFAGELSGHYYFRDMGFCDNGLFAMIRMLNLLSAEDQPLSHLIRPLRKYHATGEINMTVRRKEAIFAALETTCTGAAVDHLDGLTVSYDAWWFNLRSSNTEPVIRLNLEAQDETGRDKHLSEVIRIIRSADPSVQLKSG